MIFIDNTYLTALLIRDHINHDRAVELKNRLREKRVINDIVIIKTLEIFVKNGGKVTPELLEFLVESSEFIPLSQEDYQKSAEYYRKIRDYNACTILHTMLQNNITKIASFNPVFDRVDEVERIF